VSHERQSPFAIAFVLMLAGAIPQLALTEEGRFTADFTAPTPSAEAFGSEMTKSAVFFPAVAGGIALFLAWSMPRWLRALGFIGLGGALLWFTVSRVGAATVFNGPFESLAPVDLALLGGMALAFVATRTQADSSARLPVSLLGALGGVVVLVVLLLPGKPSAVMTWLGLVSEKHTDTFPIARGFLRNAEFQQGTHLLWFVWWNLYLAALVIFPLLCLRATPRPQGGLREGTSEAAYGALVFVLISLALTAVAHAALDHQLKPRAPEGTTAGWQVALVSAANSARVILPPLLLAGLALAGVSDLLKSMSDTRLPWEPNSGPPGDWGQSGRIPLATDRYLTAPVPKI